MANQLKFQEIGDKVYDLLKPLREECEKFLKEKLDGDKHIDLTKCDDVVGVVYDGGNHPEYNSCCADVDAVYMKDGKVYLDVRDCCDEYEIDRVDTLDLYGVCDFIVNNIN